MLMTQNRNKNFFLGGKTTDMHKKKLKTLLCMVKSVNKKFLFFCLQFSFKCQVVRAQIYDMNAHILLEVTNVSYAL